MRRAPRGGRCCLENEVNRPIPFLDLKAQQARIADRLRPRLDAVLAHCQFVLGPEVAELEGRLAAYCGARHCVGVSSGTDALQIAMMAEGIGPGDAVFLPAFTYTATAEVPLVLGATPVFVDVDPRTFQIDTAHLAARIAEVRAAGRLRPRALVGVDLFGQPADWPALNRIAASRKPVYPRRLRAELRRRACMACGSAPRRRRRPPASSPASRSAPTATAARCSPTMTTAPRCIAACAATARARRATRFCAPGMNGRLDTMQAAVLLAKLEVFDEELAIRERIAGIYDRRLGNAVVIPARVPDSASAWAVYSVLLPNEATRGPPAGGAAGGRGADRDLLSPPAASAARLCRPP